MGMIVPGLHLDFETRSELDLKKVGLHRYARHPSTDVWCAAWALDDADPQIWTPAREAPELVEHVTLGRQVFAWNAPFELEIWNEILVKRYGFPPLDVEQTYCVMAMSYAMGMPGSLDVAGYALGLEQRKDNEGHALMMRMARPRSVEPTVWWNEPEKIARLHAYCQQDVRTERAAHERLMPLSDRERRVWLLDYRINQRGVMIDVPSVKGAIALADVIKAQANERLKAITGGAVEGVTKVAQLKVWMAERGVPVESLAKQAVVDLLAVAEPEDDDDQAELAEAEVPEEGVPPDVRAALLLRQETGKASAAKFDVMLEVAGEDNRVRQLYQYHGAGPGRWAGRKVQTHNLPRDMPKPEAVEKILALIRSGDHQAIDMIYGPPLTMASKCLRSFFVAPPGKKIISGDWSNVEGRGQAWFAGEAWKLAAFIAADEKRGPGIYELAYSRMFGVPVESVKNPSEERQVGKVSELAFGYQGGVGSFHVMGKTYGVKVPDDKADQFKEAWRDAHPMIAGVRVLNERTGRYYRKGGVWRAIEEAAIRAVQAPDEMFECGYPGRQAKYKVVGSFLWCLLPSDRAICYPYPKLLEGEYGPVLTFMCVPSQDDRRKGKIIADPSNTARWARVGTYGGSLFNNIVQGFCRDFLADGMLTLDDAGAAIVLHTHDDVNLEVDDVKTEGARNAMQAIMCEPPAWAAGFPLTSKPAIMQRYGKE